MLRPFVALFGALAVLLATSASSQASVTSYCPGPPNSVGAGAVLEWRGPVDPGHGLLVVDGLPANAPLLYVYGQAKQQTPFGSGKLCVGPSAFILARSSASASGAATLRIAEDGEQEDVRWLLSGMLPGANFQVLYRGGASVGAKASTSNALEVVFE